MSCPITTPSLPSYPAPPPVPPPPPPPPPNPWANRTLSGQPALISGSTWPHRLLHVESMTSYVRQDQDIYNGIKAPQYNVLSYTWGYFKDETETPLLVHGVDWPIPAIKKSHFRVETFRNAIISAAKGVKHTCEWVWVDIACIPQVHKKETEEAKRIRGQEIGRQVEIFHRAKESFAWFSALEKAALLQGHRSLITVDDILEHMNTAFGGFHDVQVAMDFLNGLEAKVQLLETWMGKVMSHPWLLSLWTLQEMVLRSDAWILFDDGLLEIDRQDADTEATDNAAGQTTPWGFNRVKHDAWGLRLALTDVRRNKALQDVEAIASSVPCDVGLQQCEGQGTKILGRLQSLLDWQDKKGLTALNVEIPHAAYSIAQYRRVTEPVDRIYGIVQTYGISCSPFPPGNDAASKLRALEDEFGAKLVAKSPVISQLFIHALIDGRPRRSWLITQKCKFDDYYWNLFSSSHSTRQLFTNFEVPEQSNADGDLVLKFSGKAWHLDAFVESSSPSSMRTAQENKKQLFSPLQAGLPQLYQGLMLDHHVSRAVLGHVVDYFDSHESMSNAVRSLHKKYGGTVDSSDCRSTLQVALLGSGSAVPNLPVVSYVGLVLAPCALNLETHTKASSMNKVSSKDHHVAQCMKWERIGLVRWVEMYNDLNGYSLHYHLPPPHNLDCLIV